MSADAAKVFRGTVAIWFVRKGYGFITPEAGGKDVFVSFVDVAGARGATGVVALDAGQKVEYMLKPDSRRAGSFRATNVRPVVSLDKAREAARTA